MSTVPVPGGLVTVTCVAESALIFAAAPPKLTPVAPDRPVPAIVTVVPPAVLPLAGEIRVTTGGGGGGAAEANLSAAGPTEAPAGVVTVIWTVPVPGGLVTGAGVAESAVIAPGGPPGLAP